MCYILLSLDRLLINMVCFFVENTLDNFIKPNKTFPSLQFVHQKNTVFRHEQKYIADCCKLIIYPRSLITQVVGGGHTDPAFPHVCVFFHTGLRLKGVMIRPP